MHNRAQSTSDRDRTPVQREVIAKFYVPSFVSSSRSKGMVTESSDRAQAHQVRQEEAQAAAEQRRADSKPPPIDASPEVIARWMCHPQAMKPRLILGVVHLSESNTVSLRSIRGRRMILSREPEIDKSAMASVRIAYFITAIEVVLTPSYYANFLHENAILTAFPIPVPSQYPRDPRNLTMDNMARFFTSQGLAVEDIHDAALFAYVWLRDIKAVNVDLVNLVFQLRYRLYPLLMKHGIPAGVDEDLMNVDGMITHRPSAPTAGEFLERINIFPHNTAVVMIPVASTSQTHQAVSMEDTMDTSDPSTTNVIPNDSSMDTGQTEDREREGGDRDPFTLLASRLRKMLLAQRQITVWDPLATGAATGVNGAEEKKIFQVVLVDKDVRFPPRKASLVGNDGDSSMSMSMSNVFPSSSSGLSTSSSSSSHTSSHSMSSFPSSSSHQTPLLPLTTSLSTTHLHSSLSPLTRTSPVYLDGLIAPIWIRKHTMSVPAVFVLFVRVRP
ncbi:hypothetical protein C8R42DRAFT_643330 [Lentinula raphanica]|nr:hypothetical protein C8R42DRAFT_643330 [Lentinula raphanica]